MVKHTALLLILISGALTAQSILEEYIAIGLEENLALKQREFSLQESEQALKQARGMFLPSLTLEARYSRADGGRDIQFPVGDLINPIHNTLNDLLGSQTFPGNLQNVSIPFLREEEHDTRLRLVQPLFQPAIWHNLKIHQETGRIADMERRIYARLLVADIKRAYYNYLQSAEIVSLLEETEALLEESVRVNRSLFENGSVTRDVVYRAEAELSRFHREQIAAEKSRVLARAYFNFLLNRPLNTDVIQEPTAREARTYQAADPADARIRALAHREELWQLDAAVEAADQHHRLARGAFLPGASVVLDYGFQGEAYRFSGEDDYWMASVVLNWNLFNGFQDRARMGEAAAARNRLKAQRMEIERQIELQVEESTQSLKLALQALLASRKAVQSAESYFRLVDRRYREGLAPLIEFLDARSTMTAAHTEEIISRFEYDIELARLERVLAEYPLPVSDPR